MNLIINVTQVTTCKKNQKEQLYDSNTGVRNVKLFGTLFLEKGTTRAMNTMNLLRTT